MTARNVSPLCKSLGFVAALVLPLGGCDSDLEDPEIEMVEVRQGDEVLGAVDPAALSDTTFEDEVPGDAVLALLFNEPVSLTSVREKVGLSDTEDGEYEIEFKQKLSEVVVTPVGGFAPGVTYTLDVARGIEDTSGRATDRNITVNFFVAEE